ncbi:MAG: YggS family pyridoxal phosphate-dependent enzyme [Treponema sp.]|jgi:pyridoxal phosphate enzyme (YggS family)|nr:YggS family pyridoxal phosphate-dependent enzyme [Treponema sp.]
MSIAENIEKIEERIIKACLRSGRKREDITLMAVTKFMPLEDVKEAWDAGLRCFGESRVQEAVSKFDSFKAEHTGAELHLIGALQRNKAKTAAAFFDCIQSVDRESLAVELAKHAAGRSGALPVLLELRTGEDSKSGFESLEDLFKAAELIMACPTLNIRGLMTLAPNTNDEAQVRAAFRKLALARQELENRFQNTEHSFACLSMGMSGDFETAIEEGSTILRIGSAIFGDRV